MYIQNSWKCLAASRAGGAFAIVHSQSRTNCSTDGPFFTQGSYTVARLVAEFETIAEGERRRRASETTRVVPRRVIISARIHHRPNLNKCHKIILIPVVCRCAANCRRGKNCPDAIRRRRKSCPAREDLVEARIPVRKSRRRAKDLIEARPRPIPKSLNFFNSPTYVIRSIKRGVFSRERMEKSCLETVFAPAITRKYFPRCVISLFGLRCRLRFECTGNPMSRRSF